MSMDALESLLFDEARIVTAVTLARHSDLPIFEASTMLEKFYDSFKGKNNLWGVFTISGTMDRDGITCDAFVLSRESELEHDKSRFNDVKSTTLFSLQTQEIEDMYSIVASDMLEDNEFFRDDCRRAKIKASKIDKMRSDMEHGKSETGAACGTKQAALPAKSHTIKTESESVCSSSTKGREKKMDLKKLFDKACAKEKTPKNSPIKPDRESPFSSCEKKSSPESSVEKPKRRARKILIDDEDSLSPPPKKSIVSNAPDAEPHGVPESVKDEVKEDKGKTAKRKLDDGDLFNAGGYSPESSPVKSAKHEKAKKEMKEDKVKTAKGKLDDGDLFDAAGSSPEKSLIRSAKTERAKKEKASTQKEPKNKKKGSSTVDADPENDPVAKPLRRSPRKLVGPDSDIPDGKRLVTRKVTKTHVDEDGFLVTEDVFEKMLVDASEVDDVKPLTATKKVNQSTAAATVVKKAPVNQSKISSFFSKK